MIDYDLACKLYACMGAIFGVAAIVSMVVIGFDRYNVIVKGMDLSLLGYYTTCTNPDVTCFQKIRGRKCRLQKNGYLDMLPLFNVFDRCNVIVKVMDLLLL